MPSIDMENISYGNSIECAKAAVEECKNRNYLASFLSQNEEEVITLIAGLLDEEAARKEYLAAVKAEFKIKTKTEITRKLLSLGYIPNQDIAKVTGFSIEKINEIAAQLEQDGHTD